MTFHHNVLKSYKKHKYQTAKSSSLLVFMTLVFLFLALSQPFGSDKTSARDFNSEIRALENQIKDYNKRSGELAGEADNLQNKIKQLESQQANIQAQINLSGAEKAKLEQEIIDNEVKIKKQSEALGSNLVNMYYSGKTTSLDILMNSKSVSEYVDRQTRQQSMSDRIKDAVKEVKELKSQLQDKKSEVEKVIKKQQSQKDALAATQAEQQKLLEQTQGEESKYKELSSKTKAKMSQVQAEQQAAIARLQRSNRYTSITVANSSCGGGYPFCGYPADISARDSASGFWALGNTRECVNYVQWRIYQLTGRNEFHGNAGSWPTTSTVPRAGSVGVMGYGSLPYGHVVWVEQVGTGAHAGQVYVSEYNWSPYNYTERWVSANAFKGFYYI